MIGIVKTTVSQLWMNHTFGVARCLRAMAFLVLAVVVLPDFL